MQGTRAQFSISTCVGMGSPLEQGVIPSVAYAITGRSVISSKKRNIFVFQLTENGTQMNDLLNGSQSIFIVDR